MLKHTDKNNGKCSVGKSHLSAGTQTARAVLLRRPQQIGEQERRENMETGSGSEGN